MIIPALITPLVPVLIGTIIPGLLLTRPLSLIGLALRLEMPALNLSTLVLANPGLRLAAVVLPLAGLTVLVAVILSTNAILRASLSRVRLRYYYKIDTSKTNVKTIYASPTT